MNEESKELIKIEETQLISGLAMGDEFENMLKWAEMFAETKYYQTMVANGGKFAILAIFAAARDLGIPYTSALNGGLYIVQGRVQLSAQMMNLMIRKKGHSIKKKIGNAEICTLIGCRKDGDTMESTFTIQMAQRAGLVKPKSPWECYPERMLFCRALSNLAKDLFPDCIGNALIEGEIIEVEAEVVEPEPLDSAAMKFIGDFNLLDLNSDASRFVEGISASLGQSRKKTIADASKEADRFKKNLEKFVQKTKPKKEE